MKYPKITGVFSFVVGIINLVMWIMLIVLKQVPDIESSFLSYGFHWSSEFLTAILLITSGILLLRNILQHRALVFLSLGFLFNAIQGAFWYYISPFSLPFVLMGAVLTSATIVFIVINYERWEDLMYTGLGILFYGSINLIGNALQAGDTAAIIYTVPMPLAFILLLVMKRLSRISRHGPQDTPSS